jgi:PQQ-dependent catabolism-associated CXXCW motif protein
MLNAFLKHGLLLVWLAVIAVLPSGSLAANGVAEEPENYRMEEYRAPVPASLRGARVIGVDEAKRLWIDKRAVFLDVMPQLPKPDNLPAGTIWRDKERRNIPGSFWLANTGYGVLTPEMERYFHDSLTALTSGDRSREIIVYCMTNCWMSWNAAKRAIALGYRSVTWFPEGADGWEAANLPLAKATPYRKP